MTIEEKAALANAFGVRPEYLPDSLPEVEDISGFRRGLVIPWPAGALMQTPAQRAAEFQRDIAARFGVRSEYVQAPAEITDDAQ